ncbi:MAG: tyrosine-type recombinase/integrase [Hyphomonas sp.]|nr:tyrosine-type recombinase/integrase [Hyphomonas sp.]
MSLTQAKVDRAAIKNRDYRLSDTIGSGLSLRVYRSGSKSYFLRFTGNDGRQKDHKVGDAARISLKQARRRSQKLQDDLDAGIGIGEEDTFDARTFQDLVAAYLESPKFRNLKPTSQKTYRTMLDVHILPVLGRLRLKAIRRGALYQFLESLLTRTGGQGVARTCRSVLSVIFSWGEQRELVEYDPMRAVPHVAGTNVKTRVLSEKEIRALWYAIERGKFPSSDITALTRFILLTAQRSGETAEMKVKDIDFENRVWIIPEDVTKNGKEHKVPLSLFAIKLLREQIGTRRRGRVFNCKSTSVTQALKRFQNDPRFQGRFTAHDLRRTFATHIPQIKRGVGDDLIRRCINHSTRSRGALGHYNHYDYLDERREALQCWSNYVESLVA